MRASEVHEHSLRPFLFHKDGIKFDVKPLRFIGTFNLPFLNQPAAFQNTLVITEVSLEMQGITQGRPLGACQLQFLDILKWLSVSISIWHFSCVIYFIPIEHLLLI